MVPRRSPSRSPLTLALLAVLALAALSPAAASATESPRWLIAGQGLSELELGSESLSGELAPESTAKLAVPGFGITIACGSAVLAEGAIESTDKGTLALAFSECTAEGAKACTVSSFTAKAKGALKLHAGKVYAVFEPKEGESFAVILTSGGGCALPKETTLTGTFAAPVKIDEEEAEQAIAPVTGESTLALLGVGLKFGKQAATLSSPLWLSLGGSNEGEVWGSAPKPGPVLCEVELEVCPVISTFPFKTEVKGALAEKAEAVLATSLATAKCTTASITGQGLESENAVMSGEVSGLKFESCKSGETSCTVSAKNLPYKAAFTYTEAGNGKLAISALKEAPRVEVACGGLISCTFAAPSELDFEGGEPGAILASAEALSVVSGSKCPEKAGTLSATYVLQQPGGGNAQMAQRGGATTLLCALNPPENPATRRLRCPPPALTYSGEIKGSLLPTLKATFKIVGEPTKVITCAEASIIGKFEEDGKYASPGGVTELKYTGAGGGQCTSNLTGANPPVTVTVLNLPYSQSVISYARTFGPHAYLAFAGTPGNPVKILFNYAGLECTYFTWNFEAAIVNGTDSFMTVRGEWTRSGVIEGCPDAFYAEALMFFNRPVGGGPDQSLYVAGEP